MQRGPTVTKHRGGAPSGATGLARLVPALAREPSLTKLRLAALRSLSMREPSKRNDWCSGKIIAARKQRRGCLKIGSGVMCELLAHSISLVLRGLDPRIHPGFREGWMAVVRAPAHWRGIFPRPPSPQSDDDRTASRSRHISSGATMKSHDPFAGSTAIDPRKANSSPSSHATGAASALAAAGCFRYGAATSFTPS